MGILSRAIEQKKFDTRLLDINLGRNVVSDADVTKHLKSLPDDSENAEWINLETLADLDDV